MTLIAKSSYSRLLLLILILTAVVSGSTRVIVHAAVDVPDNIRVALFLNLGTNKYQSLTSIATLRSAGGINLSWRDPQYNLPAGTVPAGQNVRFAVDGYRAMIVETADFNAAFAVLKKVQASSSAAFVTQLSKSGKTVYQVSEGVYSSAGGAASALAKWTNAGVASGVQSLLSARAAGPWAVEAGPYSSAEEAAGAAEMIGNAGLDAFVALKPNEGALSYVVRIGQEKDSSTLASLQQAASAAGGLNVRIPEAGESYAVMRKDMTDNGSANKPISLYAIPAGSASVLRADPGGAGGIEVIERKKRTYRGSMEISVQNNSLAVINDVEFEQYLYSVVGTEVGSSWPPEAQKAQAVAARSYALAGGMAFKVAHVVDTTVSQAYYGIGAENGNSTAGVNATTGEVLAYNGKIISALFSSNAGGITADATEGWGNSDPAMNGAVVSPDSGPQKGKMEWYRIATASGQTGYIREDLVADSDQKSAAGIKQMRVKSDGATLRAKPLIESDALARLSIETLVVPLGKVSEDTVYSWVEGPVTSEQLLASLKKKDSSLTGPLHTLEVSGRGPSGRAIELKANGNVVNIEDPDNLRSAMGGVRSTLFSIEETGRLTLLNDLGTTRELPKDSGSIQIVGANGENRSVNEGNLFLIDGNGQVRVATMDASFVISGKGWGHGIGLSQWGARGLAEQGYDYQYILKYYYKNVTIEKDA